jgi:hypothetical protein
MGPRGRPVGRRKPVKPPHCRPMFVPQLSHVGGGAGLGRPATLVAVGRVPEANRRQDGRKSTGRSTTIASHRTCPMFAPGPRLSAVSSGSAGSCWATASGSGNTSAQLLHFCCTFAPCSPTVRSHRGVAPVGTAGADNAHDHPGVSYRRAYGSLARAPDERGRRGQTIRKYPTFTPSLESMATWLAGEGVTEVVMEATGQYWKPVWYGARRARARAEAGERPPRQDPAGP